MSTRPYATHGGLRIRQCYNKALRRYWDWRRTREPTGATGTEWLLWQEWTRQREERLRQDRDMLIAEAEAQQRRLKQNGRNSKCRDGAAASAAT